MRKCTLDRLEDGPEDSPLLTFAGFSHRAAPLQAATVRRLHHSRVHKRNQQGPASAAWSPRGARCAVPLRGTVF